MTGHEKPLIRGLQQSFTCTAVGIDVATIRWKLIIFGFHIPLETDETANELVLNLNPSQIGKEVFQCVVISSTGDRYVEEVCATVKGMYLDPACWQSVFDYNYTY